MKVLLMDLDVTKRRRLFPNLALMKLSAYHKAKGDDVFLNFPLCRPDASYASCVFTWHSKRARHLDPGVKIAGSGVDLETKLPDEIEHIKPDYDLYPGVEVSVGFTSRGCIRGCPWCIVPEKEGWISSAASIYEFWDQRHRKILLLDNNFLASPYYRSTLRDLKSEGLEVDFNQGLDIRFVDDEVAEQLARLTLIESYPGAAQDILRIPRKQKGIQALTDALSDFGIIGNLEVSHDELDAVTAAIVGQYYLRGEYEALGSLIIPRSKEGYQTRLLK